MATLHRRVGALLLPFLLVVGPAASGTALAVAPPSAVADSYSVNEDQVLTVAAPGVLGNDSASAGTLCVVGSNTTGLHGSLGSGVAADGSFSFTPDADFNGTTTFTYDMAAYTSGSCPTTKDDTATVTITVNPVNDPPTIEAQNDCADGSVTVNEDSGAYPSAAACVHFSSPGPSNESGQSLDSWDIQVASTVGFSSGPTVTKSGNDGYLHFTPAANDFGDATVTIRARDSGGTANGGVDLSNEVVVHIHVLSVDDPPVALPDSFIVLKNTTLNVGVPGVLINDSDIDSSTITAVKVTGPVHGVLTLAADGSFSYTPAAGYVGLDGFSYKASDGQLFSPSAVVSLTVTAIPPVATPTPIPTATAAPTDTPEPSVAEGLETYTPLASDTPQPTVGPSAAPGQTGQPTTRASVAPIASAAPGAASAGGGLPLPVLLVLVLFVLLVAFGAALYVPKWLRAQSGRPVDRE